MLISTLSPLDVGSRICWRAVGPWFRSWYKFGDKEARTGGSDEYEEGLYEVEGWESISFLVIIFIILQMTSRWFF